MGRDLPYTFDWTENDLRSNILAGFPNWNANEINNYVDEAINEIRRNGNGALVQGLTLYGRNIVREKIDKSIEEQFRKKGKKEVKTSTIGEILKKNFKEFRLPNLFNFSTSEVQSQHFP